MNEDILADEISSCMEFPVILVLICLNRKNIFLSVVDSLFIHGKFEGSQKTSLFDYLFKSFELRISRKY